MTKLMAVLGVFLLGSTLAARLSTVPPSYKQAVEACIEIPEDILQIIFYKPRPTDVFSLSLVCKSFNKMANQVLLEHFARPVEGETEILGPDLFKLLPLISKDSKLGYLIEPVDEFVKYVAHTISSGRGNFFSIQPSFFYGKRKLSANMLGAVPFFSTLYARMLDKSVLETAVVEELDENVLACLRERSVMTPQDDLRILWRLLYQGSKLKVVQKLSGFIPDYSNSIIKVFVDLLSKGMSSVDFKNTLESFKSLDLWALIVLAKWGKEEELKIVLECIRLDFHMDADDWFLWNALISLDEAAFPIRNHFSGGTSRASLRFQIILGERMDTDSMVSPISRTIFVACSTRWQRPIPHSVLIPFFEAALSVDYEVAYNYYKMLFLYNQRNPTQTKHARSVDKLQFYLNIYLMGQYGISDSAHVEKEADRIEGLGRYFVDMADHPDSGTEHHQALITAIFPYINRNPPLLKLIPLLVPCASMPVVLSEFERLASSSNRSYNDINGDSLDFVLDWISSHRLSRLLESNLRKMLHTAARMLEIDEVRANRTSRPYKNHVKTVVEALSIHKETHIFSKLFGPQDAINRHNEAFTMLASANLRSAFFVAVNFLVPVEYMRKLYGMVLNEPNLIDVIISALEEDPSASGYLQPILKHPKYKSTLGLRALNMASNRQFHVLLSLLQSEILPAGSYSVLIAEALDNLIEEDQLGLLLVSSPRTSLNLGHFSVIVNSPLYSDAFIQWLVLGFYCNANAEVLLGILADCRLGRSPDLIDAVERICKL